MKLVLIEGPGKRDSVQHYLGDGYKVMPTFGHCRDLPEKTLGVDVKNNATLNDATIVKPAAKLVEVTDAEGNLLFDAEQGGREPTIYLYDLANVVVTSEADSELQIQLHALKEGETIAAHQPFVIKPQADVELNMVFHNVTIVKPEEVVLGVDDVQFLPQFVPGTVTPQDGNTLITISDLSTLEEHTEAVSISGLSGYFVVTPASAAYEYAVIQVKDGVTTGIHDINTSEKPIKVMIDNQVYILYGGNMYSIIGNR